MANLHDQWWYFYYQYLQTVNSSIPNTAFVPAPSYILQRFQLSLQSWGYLSNNPHEDALHDWAHIVDLKLLFNHKQPKSFHSAVWNTHTNPGLTFYFCDISSLLPHTVHKIGGNFPKSQHSPTIIHQADLEEYTPTPPIPRWNFNKADWERFKIESVTMRDHFPSPDTDINTWYSVFQRKLLNIAKRTVPRGFCHPYYLVGIPFVKCYKIILRRYSLFLISKRPQINC